MPAYIDISKEKNKHKPIIEEKKNLVLSINNSLPMICCEINVKILWIEHFFYLLYKKLRFQQL